MHLRAFVNISLFSNGENTDGRIADDLLNQMHLRAFVNICLFSNGENPDGRIADDLFAGPVTNNIGFGTMAYLTYNARNQITIVEEGGLNCSVSLAQVQDEVFQSDASWGIC